MLIIRNRGIESQMEVVAVYNDLPMNSTIKASMITGIDFGMGNLVHNLVSTGTPPTIQEMKESWVGGLFFTNYLLFEKRNFGCRF